MAQSKLTGYRRERHTVLSLSKSLENPSASFSMYTRLKAARLLSSAPPAWGFVGKKEGIVRGGGVGEFARISGILFLVRWPSWSIAGAEALVGRAERAEEEDDEDEEDEKSESESESETLESDDDEEEDPSDPSTSIVLGPALG